MLSVVVRGRRGWLRTKFRLASRLQRPRPPDKKSSNLALPIGQTIGHAIWKTISLELANLLSQRPLLEFSYRNKVAI